MARKALTTLLALTAAGLLGAPAASAAGPWAELRRPMQLPQVAPGQPCPVSAVDESVDWEAANLFGASGIGPGPVYPALGGSDGDFLARQPVGDGLLAGKLFWYASPGYRGRVLIRGRRLDARGGMRFVERNDLVRGLRIGRRDTVTWGGQPEGSRGVPSGTAIAGAGCYGVQIDGTRFSTTAVFRGVVEG